MIFHYVWVSFLIVALAFIIFFLQPFSILWFFFISCGGSALKNLPAMQETQVQYLGGEDPLENKMATHSSIVAWDILWTEEPGRYSPWDCES